jgi:hypothetical protein
VTCCGSQALAGRWVLVGWAATGCGVCAPAAVCMVGCMRSCHPASLHSHHHAVHCLAPPPLSRRLSHYLADKKRSEKTVLEMAGKLTQQLQVGDGVAGCLDGSPGGSLNLLCTRLTACACLCGSCSRSPSLSVHTKVHVLHLRRRAPRQRGRARRPPGLTKASRRWWPPTKPSRQSWERTIETSRQPWPPYRWGGAGLGGWVGGTGREDGWGLSGDGEWRAVAGAASHSCCLPCMLPPVLLLLLSGRVQGCAEPRGAAAAGRGQHEPVGGGGCGGG